MGTCASTLENMLSMICQILEQRGADASDAGADSETAGHPKRASNVGKAALLVKALPNLQNIPDSELHELEAGLRRVGGPTLSTASSVDNVPAASSSSWIDEYHAEKARRAQERASNREKSAPQEGDILDNLNRKIRFDYIVVNLENVGNYGRRDDKHARFSWKYVQLAVESLIDSGFTVFGVCKENLCGGVPDDIESKLKSLTTVPRQLRNAGKKDDMDDHATIQLAFEKCCRMLDNDMYRDWMNDKLIDVQIQKWLRKNYDTVKLGYFFSGQGFQLSLNAKIDPPLVRCGRDGFVGC